MKTSKMTAIGVVAWILCAGLVSPGSAAEFYCHPGYEAKCIESDQNVEKLGEWWQPKLFTHNDDISSIRSGGQDWMVFSDANFRGYALHVARRDLPTLVGNYEGGLNWWAGDWNDRISSMKRL